MMMSSRFLLGSRWGVKVGGVVLMGLLLGALPSGLGAGSVWAQGSAQGSAQVSAADRRAASLAYETGVLLQAEGEFELAVEYYFEAIGLDPALDKAYGALMEAQVQGAHGRWVAAVAAADAGDLVLARRHAERALALDGEDGDIRAAARSFGERSEVLSPAQRATFERGASLAEGQNWRLARVQFETLIDEVPMHLPARAALHRAARFEQRAMALTDEGVALMQQHRLGPAIEKLVGAIAIWPYHPDASTALEQAHTRAQTAQGVAAQAADFAAQGELEEALRIATSAHEIDRSNADARRVQRDARRGLADRLTVQAGEQLEAGDFALAYALYNQAFEYVRNDPSARRGMARAYLGRGGWFEAEGRMGAAMLSYLSGRRYDRSAVADALASAERQILADADVSFALQVPTHEPAIGVSSQGLLTELGSVSLPGYLSRMDADSARFLVQVRINATDVTLRRTRSAQSSYLNSSGYASGYTQWEKRGTLDCTIIVTDRATGDVVDQWSADRWVTHSDRQQYVVGTTWRRSYWTLPTDDAVAGQLARELVDEVWPGIRDAVILARARALRDGLEAPSLRDAPEDLLELRVAATLLAAQVNEREGAAALRDLAARTRLMGD